MRNRVQIIFDRAANNYKYHWGVLHLEKLLKANPGLINEDSLCKLGLLYDHLAMREKRSAARRKYEAKALSLYRQVLRANPNSHRATWGIGRVWWHRRSRKAIPYALRAYHLKKRSGEKVGLYAQNIGLVYEALGDYRNAEKWLLRGLRENRADYGSYLNLVVFYRVIKKDFKKARKYAVKLKKLYNEKQEFKKTAWGRRITNFIEQNLEIKK